jgi:hypothetical protein
MDPSSLQREEHEGPGWQVYSSTEVTVLRWDPSHSWSPPSQHLAHSSWTVWIVKSEVVFLFREKSGAFSSAVTLSNLKNLLTWVFNERIFLPASLFVCVLFLGVHADQSQGCTQWGKYLPSFILKPWVFETGLTLWPKLPLNLRSSYLCLLRVVLFCFCGTRVWAQCFTLLGRCFITSAIPLVFLLF